MCVCGCMCVRRTEHNRRVNSAIPRELTHLLHGAEHSSVSILTTCGMETVAILGDRTKICQVREQCAVHRKAWLILIC